MLVDPAVVYAHSAQNRCHTIAQAIVDEIRRSPLTPVETHRMEFGYHVVPSPPGAEIRSAVDYWIYQEFGTHEMAANPHVRPAIETIRQRGVP